VSGGLVLHEGSCGGGGGESKELAVDYTLSDSGAHYKFVSRELRGRLESTGVQITWTERGSMSVMTARETVLVPLCQVQLTLASGGNAHGACTYMYTAWFITFDLEQNNQVLGRDFMEEVEHHINHYDNSVSHGAGPGRAGTGQHLHWIPCPRTGRGMSFTLSTWPEAGPRCG
jgi:hypothetical protein